MEGKGAANAALISLGDKPRVAGAWGSVFVPPIVLPAAVEFDRVNTSFLAYDFYLPRDIENGRSGNFTWLYDAL